MMQRPSAGYGERGISNEQGLGLIIIPLRYITLF